MKRQVRKTLRDRAGFTLVELIVVIAILGILAGVGTVSYTGYIKKAHKAADLQLLSAVNTAFASACLENGVDIQTLPNSDSGKIDLEIADQKVTSVSIYNDSFFKYYADNEDSAFHEITELQFDSERHVFLDPNMENVTVAFGYGNGVVKISTDDAKNLGNSTFVTNEDLGVEKTLEQVNKVTDIVSMLNNDLGDLMYHGVYNTDAFKAFAAAAMGIDLNDPDFNNQVSKKEAELVAAIMAANPGMTQDEAANKLYANAAVMYAANNAIAKDTDAIIELATSGNVRDSITASGDGLANAALVYGMYMSYAYATGDTAAQGSLDNPLAVIGDVETNEAFKEYMNSAQGKTDLTGYLSALNMINNSTQNTDAVSEVLVQGFNDPNLAALINQALGLNVSVSVG